MCNVSTASKSLVTASWKYTYNVQYNVVALADKVTVHSDSCNIIMYIPSHALVKDSEENPVYMMSNFWSTYNSGNT